MLPRTTSPTGSGSPATSRRPWAIASTRSPSSRSRSMMLAGIPRRLGSVMSSSLAVMISSALCEQRVGHREERGVLLRRGSQEPARGWPPGRAPRLYPDLLLDAHEVQRRSAAGRAARRRLAESRSAEGNHYRALLRHRQQGTDPPSLSEGPRVTNRTLALGRRGPRPRSACPSIGASPSAGSAAPAPAAEPGPRTVSSSPPRWSSPQLRRPGLRQTSGCGSSRHRRARRALVDPAVVRRPHPHRVALRGRHQGAARRAR